MTPVSNSTGTTSYSSTTSAPAANTAPVSIFSTSETAGSIASSGATFCINA